MMIRTVLFKVMIVLPPRGPLINNGEVCAFFKLEKQHMFNLCLKIWLPLISYVIACSLSVIDNFWSNTKYLKD